LSELKECKDKQKSQDMITATDVARNKNVSFY